MSTLYKDLIISEKHTILDSLKQMDRVGRKLLIIVDSDNNYSTLLSIGDIQRAIIANCKMDDSVSKHISQVKRLVANERDSLDSIKAKMKLIRADFMPVISNEGKVIKIYFWEELFGTVKIPKSNLDLPVVIMAGGKGARLKPITNVLPKPLIPIGEKTILEEIMDRFVEVGCARFFMSVNYKADMIKYYFDTLGNNSYVIDYIKEKEPLGTVGSLFLLKDKIHSTFFVSNCDIILDMDLEEFFHYHKNNRNKISVVSVLKHVNIPYGTIETIEDGILDRLTEKPELTLQINSGMYLLEPEVLNLIPTNTFFHITDLIEKVLDQRKRVGVFPVSEGSWTDIGDWHEYNKIITTLK